jgi:hypothetical protein
MLCYALRARVAAGGRRGRPQSKRTIILTTPSQPPGSQDLGLRRLPRIVTTAVPSHLLSSPWGASSSMAHHTPKKCAVPSKNCAHCVPFQRNCARQQQPEPSVFSRAGSIALGVPGLEYRADTHARSQLAPLLIEAFAFSCPGTLDVFCNRVALGSFGRPDSASARSSHRGSLKSLNLHQSLCTTQSSRGTPSRTRPRKATRCSTVDHRPRTSHRPRTL